jgi:exodeoxyribonuclease-3
VQIVELVELVRRSGLGIEEHDHEGRVITAEFPEYYIVTCYTPNSKDGLARLDYRMTWEDAFLAYLKKLEEKKQSNRIVKLLKKVI